ncbi:hypothetical protein LTR09_001914 [Extremus antarcticus]|uniref:Uncharacterized protein n=1 Tax=Extremus antarcticus TaxID=702011 RepID=A0AAJ0GG30_9PEZI|nr:hypothetical protein LTR09_001914 [Extremus antarcticus]
MAATSAISGTGDTVPPDCHLFRLPGELRNRIYVYFEVKFELCQPQTSCSSDIALYHPEAITIPLAFTSKQPRHEYLSTCYGGKTFVLRYIRGKSELLHSFARRSASWLPYLRSIQATLFVCKAGASNPLSVEVRVTPTGRLTVTSRVVAVFWKTPNRYCACVVKWRARDVNAEVPGSPEDALWMTLFKSLAVDKPASYRRVSDEPEQCQTCGEPVCCFYL